MGDGRVPSRICDEMNNISMQEREILQKYYKIMDEHHRFVYEKERLFRDQWRRLTESESIIEKMLNTVLMDINSELPEEDMSVESLTRISNKIRKGVIIMLRRTANRVQQKLAVIEEVIPEIANARPKTGASATLVEQPAATTGKLSKKSNVQGPAVNCRAKTSVGTPMDMVITEEDMSIISMQVNKGQPTHKCAQCHAEVTNDYAGHKEHVIKRHIGGYKEGDRAAFISKFIQFCFPGSIAINDFQCCICGIELQSSSGRRLHVGRQHSYSFVNCPVGQCLSVFPTVEGVNHHLRAVHRITCNDLEGPEKLEFEKQRIAYNHKVRLLMNHCFPYPVPSNKGPEDTGAAVDPSMDAFLLRTGTEKILDISADTGDDLARQRAAGNAKNPQCARPRSTEQIQPFPTLIGVKLSNAPMTSAATTTTSADQQDKSDASGNKSSNDEELQRRKRLYDISQQIHVENKRNRGAASFSLSNTRPYWEMQNGVTFGNCDGVPQHVEEEAGIAAARSGLMDDLMDSDGTISDREIDILEVVGPGIRRTPLNRKPKLEATAEDDKTGCVGKQGSPSRRNDNNCYKRRGENQPSTSKNCKQSSKRRRCNSTKSSVGRGGCRHRGGKGAPPETFHYRPRKKDPLLQTPPANQSFSRRNNNGNNQKKTGGLPHHEVKRNVQVAKRRNQNNVPYHKRVEIKSETRIM